jgi:hypothetical protein
VNAFLKGAEGDPLATEVEALAECLSGYEVVESIAQLHRAGNRSLAQGKIGIERSHAGR